MTETRLQKLLILARQKGIAEAAVLEAVEMFGLPTIEAAIRKGKKTMGLTDPLGVGQKAKAPAPSFWPGDTAHKAITVELPRATLDRARQILQIGDDTWDAMNHMLSEQQLADLIDYALVRRGYSEGLAGVKSKRNVFWGNWE